MHLIQQLDQTLFQLINGQWHNALADAVLPLFREKTFWIPAYLIFTGWLVWKYRLQALWILLMLVATVAISDTISHRLIKQSVKRERPCRNPDLQVRQLAYCGGGYSFTSNHATNHFALAMFILGLWGARARFWRWLLPLWAASIAYAQVYVGVHYPLDVLAGSLLGTLIGYPIGKWTRRWIRLNNHTEIA